MKRIIALLIGLVLASLVIAGPYSDQLRTDSPRSGRYIAEDGTITNIVDELRAQPINITRGRMAGAEFTSSYGERVTTGAETDYPVWPDGAIALASYGSGVTVQSTSANDSAAGTGIQALHLHYLRQDYSRVDSVIVELNGTTPVPINDPQFHWMQCMHVVPGRVGSGGIAAGIITAKNGAGTETYSEIAVGKLRCSSSFRMVPKGVNLFIDGAVGSSVSLTSDTTTLLRIVANRIDGHTYTDPLLFIPQLSIGAQNSAIASGFAGGLGPFPPGTAVGCYHSSTKAAIISCSWFGRLEPVE